jgi:carbon storage regulator
MLVLTRKMGESIYLGDDIKITVTEIKGHKIRLGIDAPGSIRILRSELAEEEDTGDEKPANGREHQALALTGS